ncbi:MAG: DNA mismatch repair protein MutS, partial [Clostridia bacterium]|nr:DNA mismatch repair protein MutS [Clostridia bacterium]
KRDVVRIITPGTVIEGSMLDESRHNYLAAIWLQKEHREIGLCFCDCSTGDINVTSLSGADMIQRLTNELGRFDPMRCLSIPPPLYSRRFRPF